MKVNGSIYEVDDRGVGSGVVSGVGDEGDSGVGDYLKKN